MQTVYKYPLPTTDEFELNLPDGARILSVQVQAGTPYLRALVDPVSPLRLRYFRLAETGHPIEDTTNLLFIDTFQLQGGRLIFHVFEQVE